MEKNSGYSMPLLPEKPKKQILWLLCLLPSLTILIGILKYRNLISDGVLDDLEWMEVLLYTGCFGIANLGLMGVWFAKLHLVPEGIAMTLLGITLKRHPAERIRLITAVRYQDLDKIALCDYSLEELTAHAYESKPKLLHPSREYRVGEWAYDYLRQRHTRKKGWRPDHRIFWLWWDLERLQALRSLYPQAQWMDLTKDKIFDEQLKN